VAARNCKRERPSPVALVHDLDVERQNDAIAVALLWRHKGGGGATVSVTRDTF
jgi:sarcosine oxidase delta subunit